MNDKGGSMGPIICNGLKKAYSAKKVVCQGVGGAYTAGIADNVGKRGTSTGAIREATRLFTMANTKCPKATIVFGGYSQGTAVMHNTVGSLPAALKNKIVAGVLFGDTKNKQDGSQVPGFPKDKVRIYCEKSDGVCWGSLNVTNGHFVYPLNGDAEKAMAFLKARINASRKSSGGSSGDSE
jgi:cutinase